VWAERSIVDVNLTGHTVGYSTSHKLQRQHYSLLCGINNNKHLNVVSFRQPLRFAFGSCLTPNLGLWIHI